MRRLSCTHNYDEEAEDSVRQNYDEDEKDKIDFNSTKKMIEDLTKLKEITTKQCKAFIKSVNAKSENLVKEPFILFLVNHPYHTMAVQEQETYSKGGEIQLLTVQFMEGINKKSKNFRDKETKEIEAFIKEIWERYTTNKNNHLGATGLKQMVEKVTGIGNIEESRIQEFLINIDEDKNGTVQREELSDFIQRGISMTAKEKEEYADIRKLGFYYGFSLFVLEIPEIDKTNSSKGIFLLTIKSN